MSNSPDPFFDASGRSLEVPAKRIRAWAADSGGLHVCVEPLEPGARIAMNDFVFNDGTAYFLSHWLKTVLPPAGLDGSVAIVAEEIIAAAGVCRVPRAAPD